MKTVTELGGMQDFEFGKLHVERGANGCLRICHLADHYTGDGPQWWLIEVIPAHLVPAFVAFVVERP